MKPLLYLAGPITGNSYQEATGWREEVMNKLTPNIICLSPLRMNGYLLAEKNLQDSYSEAVNVLSTPSGITCRDRFDVMRADAVLINFLEAKKVSIGTVMEIAWADLLRKPIIIAMETDNAHNHGMIKTAAGFIVPTLNEAINVVRAVLLP